MVKLLLTIKRCIEIAGALAFLSRAYVPQKFLFLLAFMSLRLLTFMQTCPLPVRGRLLVLGDVGGGEETMQGLDGPCLGFHHTSL